MDFTYPKNQKLKSRTTINLLFTQGKSVSKYPLRLVYVEDENQTEAIKISVSVSKKYFKKAVDRNYYKRVLRESYRLNKHIIFENTKKKYAILFLYQTAEKLDFQELQQKTIQLFEKFIQAENNSLP